MSLDFGIRPDLVTFPLPTINGSAAVPSTLDVLVNGNRLLNQQVEAGPFQVPQIPVITGAGTVSMTLTNALGRQVTTTLPFYASSSLLAAGLQSYSLQAGSLRRDWGLVSNSYGSTVASASYRRGISSAVTIEGTTEVAAGVQMGGGGVAVNLDNIAIFNADVAASTGPGRSGTMLNIGLSRVGQVFSAGAFATLTNGNFGDLASIYGDLVPKLQMNANAGLSLGRFGSVGVAYSSVDRNGVSTPSRFYLPAGTLLNELASPQGRLVSFTPAQHAHVLSMSYSVQIGNVSWYATGYRDFASHGATGALIGLTIPLGNSASVSTSVGTGSSGSFEQAQISKPALLVGDVGYQALLSHAEPDHQFAQLQYKAPFALLTAGADRLGTQNAYRGEAQGSVSMADGALFASNFINDSFAVVDTNGLPNVRVQLENREIGRTDSAGKLLVPDLRSFDINHVTIEPTDIPADASLASASQNVRPQDRSGVVVRFPIKFSHAALLHLVDEAGVALPVGSAATLRPSGSVQPVGYDGQTYVPDLEAHNELVVVTPNGRRCQVSFDYRPVAGDIPLIGPLRCVGEAP